MKFFATLLIVIFFLAAIFAVITLLWGCEKPKPPVIRVVPCTCQPLDSIRTGRPRIFRDSVK